MIFVPDSCRVHKRASEGPGVLEGIRGLSCDRGRPCFHNRFVRRLMRHSSKTGPTDQFSVRAGALVTVGLWGFLREPLACRPGPSLHRTVSSLFLRYLWLGPARLMRVVKAILLLKSTRFPHIAFTGCLTLSSHPHSQLDPTCLAGRVHATEKPAEMPRQPHEQYRDRFDRQAVLWQRFFWMAPRTQVDPKHKPDQHT
jgi:hypothetical protein